MTNISVCIICKNEEKYIARCLESLTEYNLEIVVVDTGSSDDSVAIAKRYTDKVYDYKWEKDFSKARNYSIEQASNNWILILDCDEFVDDFNIRLVKNFMKAYPDYIGEVICKNEFFDLGGEPYYKEYTLPRFFNRKFFHYEGAIHEQITPININLPLKGCTLPISFIHVGYNLSAEMMREKQLRNIELLRFEIEINSTDPYTHYQLGVSYLTIKDYKQAIESFNNAINCELDFRIFYTNELFLHLANAYIGIEQYPNAIEVLENAKELLSDYSDYYYALGSAYYKNNMIPQSILSYIQALNASKSINIATKDYMTHYSLGNIYERMGDTKMALSFYNNCRDYHDTKERINRLS